MTNPNGIGPLIAAADRMELTNSSVQMIGSSWHAVNASYGIASAA
jgi:hypothetical protein